MNYQVMPHNVLSRPEWADKINGHWRASFDGILAVGAALIEAKATLPHGEFEAMVEQDLPFSPRTGQMLVSVVTDQRISNANHGSHLPTSWRTLYELTQLSDDEFQRGLDDGIICPDMTRKDLQAFKTPHVAHNSGENEWYTPAPFLELARHVMGGIDLDPASCEAAQKTVQAAEYFTIETDGLVQEWHGRVWMNPPYEAGPIKLFTAKLCNSPGVTQAMVLVNNATETGWFQDMAERCSAILFPKARVKFIDKDGNPGAPLQGQALLYFGPNVAEFTAQAATLGLVVTR